MNKITNTETDFSLLGMFWIENGEFDRNSIIELIILLIIFLYGFSGILKFSVFVPREDESWDGDSEFCNGIEIIIRFIISLWLLTYSIFISQNIYIIIWVIINMIFIIGKFVYLIDKKKKEYTKFRGGGREKSN